jgi:hypothetical protein
MTRATVGQDVGKLTGTWVIIGKIPESLDSLFAGFFRFSGPRGIQPGRFAVAVMALVAAHPGNQGGNISRTHVHLPLSDFTETRAGYALGMDGLGLRG